MLRSVTFVALAAYVSAQSISGGCKTTISGLALNADVAACFNPVALLPLFTGNTSTAITPLIDNWLTGFCRGPACSNATIAAVIGNLTEGCADEAGPLLRGVGEDTQSVTEIAQRYFPTLRKVVCLKEGDDHCVTKSLKDAESVVGPLSPQSVVQLVLSPPMSLLQQQNFTCTSCTKQAYNVIVQDFPEVGPAFGPVVQNACGDSFIDGSNVTSISQSANTDSAASRGNNNGAVSLTGGALSSLAVVSAVYALLV